MKWSELRYVTIQSLKKLYEHTIKRDHWTLHRVIYIFERLKIIWMITHITEYTCQANIQIHINREAWITIPEPFR